MKRANVLILFLLVFLQVSVAQCKFWGLEAGVGISFSDDDLFFNDPVLAWNGNIYFDYYFPTVSYVTQHSFLRFGLGIGRRGSRFEMDFPYAESTREGYYNLVSLQLPFRFGWRFIPFFEERTSVLSLWAGPSVSFALFGVMYDKQVSGRYDSEAVNFDRIYRNNELFGPFRRIDVDFTLGVMYVINSFTFNLLWEMGFIQQRERDNALPFVDVRPEEPTTGYFATNRALLLSLGYQFDVRRRPHRASPDNAIFM